MVTVVYAGGVPGSRGPGKRHAVVRSHQGHQPTGQTSPTTHVCIQIYSMCTQTSRTFGSCLWLACTPQTQRGHPLFIHYTVTLMLHCIFTSFVFVIIIPFIIEGFECVHLIVRGFILFSVLKNQVNSICLITVMYAELRK